VAQELAILEEGHCKRQHWVTNEIGELLTIAPRVSAVPSLEQVSTALSSYVDELAGGNGYAFARLMQSNPKSLNKWLHKKTAPQLQCLLQICFHLGVSLVDFLTTPKEGSRDLSPEREYRSCIKQPEDQHQRFSREQLQLFLEVILEDEKDAPPSLRDVARRLGCIASSLYAKFPDLARAISARHREYQRAMRQKQVPEETIWVRTPMKPGHRADLEKLRQALEAVLADKESIPPSMRAVARQLGYRPSPLAGYFPDLCHAISARYLEYRRNNNEAKLQICCQQVRQVMLKLHEQGCYPSARLVKKQLGNDWLFVHPKIKAVKQEVLNELQGEMARYGIS